MPDLLAKIYTRKLANAHYSRQLMFEQTRYIPSFLPFLVGEEYHANLI